MMKKHHINDTHKNNPLRSFLREVETLKGDLIKRGKKVSSNLFLENALIGVILDKDF